MKKRKILSAVLLVFMTSQFALSKEWNEDFNSSLNKDLDISLSEDGTGSITNSGKNNVSLSNKQGKHKFTGSLKNSGGGKFTNNVDVVVTDNDKIENSNGTFTNKGSITNNGTVDNSAKMEMKGGTFTNNGTFVNNHFDIQSNSTFTNNGEIKRNEVDYNGKKITSGTIIVSGSGTTFENKGIIDQVKLEVKGGTFKNNKGSTATFDNFIVKDYKNSRVSNYGELNVNKKFTNSKEISNSGSINLGANSESVNRGNIDNHGVINSKGDFDNKGTLTNSFVFNNDGKMTNDEKAKITNNGFFKNKGSFTNKGSIEGTGILTNTNGGNFTNNGTISTEVINDGATFTNEKDAELKEKFTNQNGAVFNNNGNLEKEVENKNGSIFNNKGSIHEKVKNENATVNNEGRLSQGIESKGGVVNNIGAGSIESAGLSDGAILNNEGSINDITGSDSTVNNNGTITGSIATSESGSGLTVNNYSKGNINKSTISGATVNNSGTVENATLSSNATLNNNSDGTVKGTTNVNDGSTLYNDGTIEGTVNVGDDGTLHLGANSKFGQDGSVQMKGHLDLTNGKFDDVSNNVMVYGGSSVSTDLSSATGQTDRLFAVRGGVTLEDFNFIPDTLVSNGFFSKKELSENMGLGESGLTSIKEGVTHRALSPLRWLRATSTSDGIMFGPTGNKYKDFNPSVMASPIAAQIGGYLTQLNSYDEAFRNMDMYMLMTKKERQAMKLRNKYAAADGNLVFDPTGTPYSDKGVWIRPYGTFENVPLKGGPRVSNVAYGSYFGIESELYDLGHGWDGMYGVYAGYNGSHQAYDHTGIYQNGGTLGLVGMAYKGNFFTGLTINAGANIGEADTFYGQDNFTLLMAGIANKTGYNWELAEGKFIIQPSLMTSYSFVNTFDYKTASGINVNSDALHAVTFEPGLKFIGNLKHGWQPYAGISVVWNILDKTDFQASDASLPELSVKPFIKYGLGVRKTWGERLTGFFQTYFTGGGRNGVGFQLGFRMTLGKGGNSIKTSHTPDLPKTQLKLSRNN